MHIKTVQCIKNWFPPMCFKVVISSQRFTSWL